MIQLDKDIIRHNHHFNKKWIENIENNNYWIGHGHNKTSF